MQSYLGQAIADRVRTLRKERGLTQAELAAAAGVSEKAIVRIESGQGNPSLSTCGKIGAAFEMSVFDLFDANAFKVAASAETPAPPARHSQEEAAMEAVLAAVERDARVTIKAIVRATGIGHTTIDKAIDRLKAEGQLERVGPPRGGYWRIPKRGD